MDNFWLWMLLGLAIAVIGAGAVLRKVRANNAKVFQAEVTPERAATAAAKLSAEEHRSVYRFLATDNLLGAAQAVRQATRQSARDCLLDVQALARFPQVSGGAQAAGEQGEQEAAPSGVDDATDASPVQAASAPSGPSEDEPTQSVSADEARLVGDNGFQPADPDADEASVPTASEEDWVIPDDWETTYGGDFGGGERHMEFTHHDGEQLRRFSTQDLPDAERDQIMSQLRDGEVAEAARLISEKVGLGQEEVEMALRANHDSGRDKVDGVAVRFNREDGETVEFSTQDLSEPERVQFIAALRMGDLATASELVAQHTGLSQEQALGMLKAFRPPQ
ncbi:MAG: hypothetical protein ACTIJJ_07225 [Galactobacter sp.]